MGDSTDCKQLLTEKIIQTATMEFMAKGIKAVKMDDIAKKLSISKRTLYETFLNKEQLLLACVKAKDKEMQDHYNRFVKEVNPSVIEVTVEFYRFQLQGLNGMTAQFLMELHKYPTVFKWLEGRHEKKDEEALKFFRKGVEEGYFRKDVNYSLIEDVCSNAMDYSIQQGLINKYSVKDIFKDVMMLYIRGFCTLKGIEALEKLL